MEYRMLDAGFIRQKIAGLDCILCMETAAEYLALSNGGYTNIIRVYSTEIIDRDGIDTILVDNYDNIESSNVRGIICTTEEQTIIDMLIENRNTQAIMESLSYYYYSNNESFDKLITKMPLDIVDTFRGYEIDSIEYYND